MRDHHRARIWALAALAAGIAAGVAFACLHHSDYRIPNHTPMISQRTALQIDPILKQILRDVPHSVLARVGLVHTANAPGQPAVMQFSIVAGFPAATFGPGEGPRLIGVSLTAWAPYLARMDAGQCAYIKDSQVVTAAYLHALGVSDFNVCPLMTTGLHRQLIGAVYLFWSPDSRPTAPPESYFPQQSATAHLIARAIE